MKRLLSIGLLLLWSATAPAAVIKTIQAGATDQTVVIKIIDSTDGTPETGVVFNTSGIDLEYWRHGANSVTDITEATQTVSGAHTDGGFVSLGNGYYRLDLPDAAVATGATAVEVMGTVTGMIVIGGTVDLSPPVNVVSYGGTAGTFASGRPEVNATHIAGSAVSTSSAQIGVNVVNAGGTAWGSGAITAAAIATDAIGSAEIADGAIDAGALATDTITAAKIAADAIGASEIAADAIGAAEIANAAIDAATFAAGAIDASAIATDAIGAAEIAADAIGTSELATGAITTAEFAAGAINAAAIAADAIGASEVAADVSTEFLSGLAGLAVNATQISGDSGAADRLEAILDSTCGSYPELGITRGVGCTAQAYTEGTPSLTLDPSAAFGDNTLVGATILICGSTQGYCQPAMAASNVGSTDVVTLSAALPVAASGTITYTIFGTAASAGSVSIAAGGITSSSFAAGAIDASAIAADAIGASEIAADAIGASEIATDAIGAAELAASAIGSSEIADGAITSAEFGTGAITATVIASDAITSSEIADGAIDAGALATDTITAAKIAADAIGASEIANAAIDAATFAAGAIDAAAIATDAIGAAEVAADAGTELGTATWASTTRLLTAGTNIVLAKGTGITGFNDLSAAQVNTEVDTALTDIHLDHLLAADYDPASKPGVATALLNELVESDAGVSRFTANALEQAPTGGGESLAAIADAVWDELLSGHAVSGSTGEALTSAAAGGGLDAAGVRAAVGLASANLDTQLSGIQTDTNAIEVDTQDIQSRLPAALVSGRMDSSTGAMAANVMTAAAAAADLTTELQAGIATSSAVSSIDTKLGTPAGASMSADTAAVKSDTAAILVDTAEIGVAGAGLTAVDDGVLAAIEQTARADAAILNCEVNTANFAGSTTTVACILTDRDGGAVTVASNDLEGRELLILSGTQLYEGRFITDSTWDAANSELRLTLSRALPGTLADAVTAIIR